MTCPRILILDSGVGGLSVLQEISQVVSGAHIDYLADHAFFPYGTKSPSELIARVSSLIQHAINKSPTDSPYDLAVIACNTASTVVLEALRARFDMPFVGVVPAIKPACALSSSKRVGVLATEGTVTREYTRNLINDFGQDNEITLVGSARLVELAEQKLAGEVIDIYELQQILYPLKEAQVDTVVLGCTHFPLLKEELGQAADWSVSWVDSGQAIARRVSFLLKLDSKADPHRAEGCSDHKVFYSTDLTKLNSEVISAWAFSQILPFELKG
ncbi:glutamate racemase [Litoribrevibacter euphylliae]|uniref:Glutamate racemase n=1 Tax=Litoribrevibacter euphylliae TaxID=1834034 RepID=A0ABV7HDA0_9GAMM